MTAFLLSLNWESFPILLTMNSIFATLPRSCVNQSLQCGPQTFSVVNRHHVLNSKFSTPDLLSQKFSRRVQYSAVDWVHSEFENHCSDSLSILVYHVSLIKQMLFQHCEQTLSSQMPICLFHVGLSSWIAQTLKVGKVSYSSSSSYSHILVHCLAHNSDKVGMFQ